MCQGNKQLYFCGLFSTALGSGPAISLSSAIVDLDYFRGSFGAKAAIPLYRDAAATQPNILPGLLDLLSEGYGRPVTPEDFAAYLYAVLASPGPGGYVDRFWDELESCQLRVPLTRDAALFDEAATLGRRLIHLHTYGERFASPSEPGGPPPRSERDPASEPDRARDEPTRLAGRVPQGQARLIEPVPDTPDAYPDAFRYDRETQTLRIRGGGGHDPTTGPAGVLRPVSPAVWDYQVSGLKVLQSWLGYRMRDRKGRKSSPLDDIGPERWTAAFSRELLDLLWILEATLATAPAQADLLERIAAAPLWPAASLPSVPPASRQPPRPPTATPPPPPPNLLSPDNPAA